LIYHRRNLRFFGHVAPQTDGCSAVPDDPVCFVRSESAVQIAHDYGSATLGEHARG
jgi:hypothetical protein